MPEDGTPIGSSVLRGDVLLPAMVLVDSAVEHNLALMHEWCEAQGVSIAPHGKTTMSPELFDRQLAAGAWGITAATVAQAQVMRSHGVARVLIANQVVDAAGAAWLASQTAEPDAWVACLVDSAEGAAALAAARAPGPAARPLPVLVELGLPGGRTGCRSVAEALELARLVHGHASLALAGVEAFEGVVHSDDSAADEAAVDALLADLRALAEAAATEGLFDADEAIVSAGGSVWFDRVAIGMRGIDLGMPTRVLLRSGCYLTHDSGYYDRLSPFGERAASAGAKRFKPAIEVWAAVLSRPEPGLALVGMGKRDVAHDIDLPVPQRVARHGELRPAHGMTVFDLNDQHAFLRVPEDDPLAPGDVMCFGISHPCTAFDKWRLIHVVDDDGVVTGALRTFF